MTERNIVLVLGILFTAIGLMGFVPAFLSSPTVGTVDVGATPGYGYLLGLFPVNLWHNLVHLAFGIWGLSAARTIPASRQYGRSVAIIYGVLTIMGLIPVLNTTFGLIPLFGHDIWLHAVITGIAAYVGWGTMQQTATMDQTLRRRAG